MRKVTASAVVLTALTGCGQSGIPSTQWSFEVPDGNETVGIQRFTDSDTHTSFVSEVSSNALSGPLSGLGQTSTGAMMGPAFEQPAAAADTATSIDPAVNAFANGDFSALVTTATNPRSNAFIQSTARPDPIAQARSYLNRSYRPTSVISRVRYTSQVYLPTTPAAAPLSALGAVPATPIASSVSAPQASPARSVFQPTTTTSVASVAPTSAPTVVSQVPVPPSPVAAWTSASSVTTSPSSVPSIAVAHSASASTSISSSELPTLEPNESIVALASEAPVSSPAVADSDVPIGTSILMELQQDVSNSLVVEPSEVSRAVASHSVTPQPDLNQSAVAQPVGVQAVEVTSAQTQPTLARLLAGIPQQTQSSEIVSFRPPAEDRVEALSLQDAPENPTIRYDSSEADVNQPSSLLSRLGENEPMASTIYIPIPEDAVSDASAKFVQAAIAALEQEASQLALIAESSAAGDDSVALEIANAAEIVEAIQSDTTLQNSTLSESERVTKLLNLIRGTNRVPSLVPESEAIPVEASREDNIQANLVNSVRTARQHNAGVSASPAKQSVRKYRQRISWSKATI